MSEEPRERSQEHFLGHTEPSMTQDEPQEIPQESSFSSSTVTQETYPFYGGIFRDGFGFGLGLDDGDIASILDELRYEESTTMIDTLRDVHRNTYDENDKRQPYMGSTSFTSSTGSSQQLHGQGNDTISYNTSASQSIPSMITQRNSSLITSMGSQRNSDGHFGDSDTLFTGSTASSQQTYHGFETPRMQANFGGNIASTNNYNRGNIPSMTSQRYSGGLHGDSDEEYDCFSNFSDISSMIPPRIPTTGNSKNMMQGIGGQYGPMMIHSNGNLYGASTTPVGTRKTNTSHKEPQQWTIRKKLTKTDINCLNGRIRLPFHDVERDIKPNISDFDNRARDRTGIFVEVYDHDKSTMHNMVLAYRYGYGYYLAGKWGTHLMRKRGLKVGDTIGMAWDTCSSRLLFSVLSETAQEKEKLS